MSAFLHGNDHIDLLVTYATQLRPGWPGLRAAVTNHAGQIRSQSIYVDRHQDLNADVALPLLKSEQVISATQLGRVLLAQNVRSMLHRYEDEDAERIERMQQRINSYQFRPVRDPRLRDRARFARVIITACTSYRYQSCESRDLEATHAGQWITAIFEDAAQTLATEQPEDPHGWSYQRP